MGKYTEMAREAKKRGVLCSDAIYNTFKDVLNLSGNIPAPRSIDGKCGAVLATEQILKELGKEDLIEEFEKEFLEEFGSLKCVELMRVDKKCSFYTAKGAKKIEDNM